ncbi:MAG TPA: MmcQ/YjbR family DNA-binding protein [Enteractinococcus helveticum]|uniref:MmcQ/YjbR family DNA-binding protein n=1 Tax=Enteractinococcus helveticum TaxID=1837282 RepID=A0A921FKT0_9MICC|nr:MmcQ/YjbR family DNA-binding protein [Enteractinococcus helveticum]HJF13381.1 MmcQ/YjbR family DNA-binding protein [Enteractinococcus helveticum]
MAEVEAVLPRPFQPDLGTGTIFGAAQVDDELLHAFACCCTVHDDLHSLGKYVGQTRHVDKAEPEDAAELRLQYPEITPGYYMNKRHWISLATGTSNHPGLFQELLTDSYRLVVARLPRVQRPIDPETFGTSPQT